MVAKWLRNDEESYQNLFLIELLFQITFDYSGICQVNN